MKKTATKGAKRLTQLRTTGTKKRAAAKKNAPAKKAAARKQTGQSNSATDGEMLQEFLLEELKDVYWAEKHLLKVLPKMQKQASSQELKDAIQEHIGVTESQVERLEDVFEILGETPKAKKCDGMTGITEEGNSAIGETQKGSATRDVCIILAGQKVEHYEIAAYGTLATLSRTLGKNDIADIFKSILEEEKYADQVLTSIAENNINVEASEEEEEE